MLCTILYYTLNIYILYLLGCVKVRREPGFFGGEIKIPEGGARKKQALDAWNTGKEAINQYITIANSGLMLELTQIEKI